MLPVPLVKLEACTSAIITEVCTTEAQKSRLCSLGIAKGMRLYKLRPSPHDDPVIVETEHRCILAIGYDIAQCIMLLAER